MARRLVYVGSLNGTAPIYKPFQVNNTQTIYRGDVVVLATNKASIAADAAAAGTVLGVSNTDIVTTTATAADIVYVDVNPASVYEAKYTGTAPVVGNKYDFGTAAYTVDGDDTTGGFLQVVPLPDGTGADTTNTLCHIILCNRVYGMA